MYSWRLPIQLIVGGALATGVSIAAVRQFELHPSVATIRMSYAAPSLFEVEVALRRAGISPESLTAAGVSHESVAAIVSRVETLLTDEAGLVQEPQQNYSYAKNEHDRLTRLVQSGQASQQEITDCQTASQSAATHLASLNSALDDVFAEATNGLTQTQIDTLAMIRANERSWRMPTEFLVISRDQSDWIRLREALANERIADKHEGELDQADQTFLSNERAKTAIALAISRLDTNLSQVQSAWDTATTEE